ncbi:MAG: hypothetical protein M3416_06595 [Acidobacteriota bacterium]|nr:hypothetical protein [Acidobacteriota bacterium]
MTRKLPGLLAFCICSALLLLACGGGGTNSGNAGNTAASNTGSSTSPAGGDKIGVPECDDYIAKYEACVNSKVPEAMRATVRAQLDTARTSWRQLAGTAQGRAGLAQACKAAHDAAKQSMSSYGCSF